MATCFLCLAFFRARERRLAEQQRLGERAQEHARIAAASLEASVSQVQTLLQSVALTVDPAAPTDSNDAVLRRLFASIPSTFGNLIVLDSTGHNVGAAVVPASGRTALDLPDRPYIIAARTTGAFTVGLSVRSRSAPGAPWIIPMVLPLRATDGQTAGFVVASVRIDSLEAVKLARTLPPKSVLTVIDPTGRIVIRSLDGDAWNTKMFPGYPEQESKLQPLGVDTVVPSPVDSTDRLFGTQQMLRPKWRLFVGIPVQEVFAPSRRQFIEDVALGLALSLAILLFGWWLTARLVTPIESLTEDAQAVSDGDMTRRSTIDSADEVGTLARTFNQMADAIVERNERLATSAQQLREAQKLEALGAFAGGIAHDFNNYLTSIVGHAQLALDTVPTDTPVQTELDGILDSAQRASELAKQILVFSRRQVVEPTDVSVHAVIHGMHRLLARLLGERIMLRLVLAPQLGCVRMDQGQLEQVIVNLIVNARDAMPSGGECWLRTSRRDVEGHGMVCIEVEDTGEGIPVALRDRIFDPFFTTKARTHGTGLGLSISYGIVTAAGGTISVDASEGGGARFVILLPEGPVVAPMAPSVPASPPQGHAERILLVDDDESVLLVGGRLLSRGGYAVVQASSAEEALSLLASETFDLIVSDVLMPGMTGPQMMREVVQAHGPTRVLFVSGYPDDDLIAQEIASHHAEFLAKPFTQDGLLRKVRDMLDAPIPANGRSTA